MESVILTEKEMFEALENLHGDQRLYFYVTDVRIYISKMTHTDTYLAVMTHMSELFVGLPSIAFSHYSKDWKDSLSLFKKVGDQSVYVGTLPIGKGVTYRFVDEDSD